MDEILARQLEALESALRKADRNSRRRLAAQSLRIYNAGSKPSQGPRYCMGRPVQYGGTEAVGSTASAPAPTGPGVPVLILDQTIPADGTDVLAVQIDGRWVAGSGSIPVCANGRIPVTVYVCGAPTAGISVRLQGPGGYDVILTTNASGQATFTPTTPGEYVASVVSPGFSVQPLRIQYNCGQSGLFFSVPGQRNKTVSGKIYGCAGYTLAGVTVQLYTGSTESTNFQILATTTSAGDGSYSFTIDWPSFTLGLRALAPIDRFADSIRFVQWDCANTVRTNFHLTLSPKPEFDLYPGGGSDWKWWCLGRFGIPTPYPIPARLNFFPPFADPCVLYHGLSYFTPGLGNAAWYGSSTRTAPMARPDCSGTTPAGVAVYDYMFSGNFDMYRWDNFGEVVPVASIQPFQITYSKCDVVPWATGASPVAEAFLSGLLVGNRHSYARRYPPLSVTALSSLPFVAEVTIPAFGDTPGGVGLITE